MLDLSNTFIKVKGRVMTPDGINGVPVDAQVAPINNLLHSILAKLEVSLNRKIVCSSDYHYAHRAHNVRLLNFDSVTKKVS